MVPICKCSTKVFLYVLFVCIAIVSKPNSKLNSTINIKFRSQLRTQSSNQFIHTLFSSCTCLRWCECSTITSVVRSPTCNAHRELTYFVCDALGPHARKPRLLALIKHLPGLCSATHTRSLGPHARKPRFALIKRLTVAVVPRRTLDSWSSCPLQAAIACINQALAYRLCSGTFTYALHKQWFAFLARTSRCARGSRCQACLRCPPSLSFRPFRRR